MFKIGPDGTVHCLGDKNLRYDEIVMLSLKTSEIKGFTFIYFNSVQQKSDDLLRKFNFCYSEKF
jgi:hypothetical protein